jgi:hypothetical protein
MERTVASLAAGTYLILSIGSLDHFASQQMPSGLVATIAPVNTSCSVLVEFDGPPVRVADDQPTHQPGSFPTLTFVVSSKLP